jgi:glycosyltransferase involved in cell wall biosynthesis
LGEELGKHDVYVSGSRFDPGPNHVLEALACGLPTYVHQNGGGAVEFAGEDHTYEDWKQLEQVLTGPTFTANSFVPPEWNDCVQQYVTYLEQVMSAP